ncbi:MAG: hypothetical protein P8J75_00005, partial [Actinomycetota bacterium]|nr:hypothetical protein [Actinomycetota bacterium]
LDGMRQRPPGRLIRSAWRRGRLGSGGWMALAIMGTGFRLLKVLSRRRAEVAHTAELKPGESLRIRHLPEDQRGRQV